MRLTGVGEAGDGTLHIQGIVGKIDDLMAGIPG